MDLEEQPLTSAPAVSHGGGSSSRQIMQSMQMFLAGASHQSPPVSRVSSSKSVDGSPELDKNYRYVDIEEGVVECVNSDQTAPLLVAADNTSQSKKRMKTLVRVIHSVQAFKASVATACVHRGSTCATEEARYDYKDIEEGVVECVNSDQTSPLLLTVDNTSHSIQAFKAHETSLATARVHSGSTSATEGNYLQHPQVDEASDSSATSSEHHETIKTCATEEGVVECVDIEEGVVECVNSDQTAPLLVAADNTSQSKKRMKTLVRVIHSVQAFKASVATACVHRGSTCATEEARYDYKDIEEGVVECVNSDQTSPLLLTVDNTSHSIQAFKAHETSLATARVHSGSTSATEGNYLQHPQVDEASDSSATSSEHHETIKTCATEEGVVECVDIEEGVVECVNSDQTAPLLVAADNTSQSKKRMKTLVRVIHSVQAFKASVATACVHRGSTCATEEARYDYKDIEEGVVECVNSDQTSPLLLTVDNTSHSIQAFKAHETSLATARVHSGSTSATEGNYLQHPQVDEASDSSATSSEHHETIKKISTIVSQKNLLALQEFGDLGRVKFALCTDFDNGISDNEALNRSQQHASSRNPAPTKTFFHFVWEEVKKKTIILLLVSVALSSVLGILQDGLKNDFFEEVVILIAIVLLVLFASIRKYWQEKRAQKKLRNQEPFKREVGEVQVRRGGQCKVICKSELVQGDILLLKKGDEVPCDGLFIGGEPQELESGDESCIVNEQKPFLSHGEKVKNGDARMVVTSTNMDSGWSEMMRKAICEPNMKFRLVTQLDKLNTRMHIIQIVDGILLVVVLIIRYAAGQRDGENGNGPESVAEPTGMRSISDTFMNIIKSKYTTKVLTKLLSVSLVGLTEGVPFVVSIAIVYWNDKTLSGKATEQDPHGLVKMAHVTRVCTDTFFTKDVMEVEKVFIGGNSLALSPDVIDVSHDGIDTLSQKPFRQVKVMFRSKRKGIWRGIEMKGAMSFEEPCGVLMRETEESEELVWHFNGPVTEILKQCKHYYDINGNITPLNDEMTRKFVQANQDRQDKHKFTTVALASCAQTQDVNDLILIALLVLKNKNNEDTNAQVITALRERRIETVIVSSKKIPVIQQDIACEYEVITNCDSEEPFVVTGKVFRNYTNDERLDKVDKIHILGEALPSDQLLLVETMKEKGEVVAFLGQATNEAPALKTAHIGIAVGTWSSEKAKENCDIIMNGSFVDLISMVDSGKCIYDNIECFLQIVLITTCGSTLTGLIEIAVFGDASLTIFQLALVKFAVVFLGGLALLTKELTDKPSSSVPISCEQSVTTTVMARNILFQVLYQAICSVVIQLIGPAVMGPDQDMKAVVSKIFILCQFFNLFNSRELQKKNCFKGIHQHKEFWVAIAMFIVLHAAFSMGQDFLGFGTRMNWKLWTCVLLGAISLPVDWLGKYIWRIIKIFCQYRLR